MTILQLLQANEVFDQLSRLDTAKELKLTGSARILLSENRRRINKPVRDYLEQQDVLIKELGEPIPETNPPRFQVPPASANYPKLEAAVKEMQKGEIEIKLSSLTPEQLFGNEKLTPPEKLNQIPFDLVAVMLDLGLIDQPAEEKK